MRVGDLLEEISQDICDNYCKYPQVVHEMYLRDMITEDEKQDYMIEHYCNSCPLVEKM